MEPEQLPKDSIDQSQTVDESRRRFTKTGVAASGLILTLASRPVMGTGTSGNPLTCKSPSGFLSGNQSTHGTPPTCLGRSPGYWKNHPESWPCSLTTTFKSVFGCPSTSVYAKYTLMQLCSPQGDDKNNLGMHLTAAWLNAKKGWTPFLTEETIRAMYTEWQNTGSFSPTAGVYWNAEQIVSYIKGTQA
jgi:hypothetical protein